MIDPEAFKHGMNKLSLLPTQGGADTGALAARKVLYYEALSPRMTTDEWLAACAEAFTSRRWFPLPAELLELAEVKRNHREQLPELPPSEEEKERRREECRKGLAMIREAIARVNAQPVAAVVAEPLKSMLEAEPSEEMLAREAAAEKRHVARMAELKRQAEEITVGAAQEQTQQKAAQEQ